MPRPPPAIAPSPGALAFTLGRSHHQSINVGLLHIDIAGLRFTRSYLFEGLVSLPNECGLLSVRSGAERS
ncbi:MAG: hypothetical protein AAEJ52_21705 [Myxococcota bacterium]